MTGSVIVTGMVLSAAPVGDYDKRLIILTRERGRITAFARGARRPNSPLLAPSNPFSFGEFVLYEGRTSYNVTHASISNYFMELLEDFEGAYFGFYFMEFADYYTRENVDETEMLKLLYQSLRALAKKTISRTLIRYIFELKTLVINGEYPQVFGCVNCGDKESPALFSSECRGLVCRECAGGVADGIMVDGSTLYTMQFIISAPIEKLYTFKVSSQVLRTFSSIMDQYRGRYVDRHFKSLDIIKQMKLENTD